MADMLVTPEELASYLQSDLDRATAELAISTATGMVQATCRQRLVQVDDDALTLIGPDGHWLELPERPVSAVSSVRIGATAVADWTLYIHPTNRAGRLWRRCGWKADVGTWSSCAPPQVTVTYSHGYAAGDQGLGLARSAVLMLAASSVRNPNGVRSESIDDYQVSYTDSASQPIMTPTLRDELRRRYGTTAGSTTLQR